MENENLDFALTLMGGALMQRQQADTLLACNEITAARGLVLTQQSALALVKTRSETLKKTGRIELGAGIVDKLIMAFYDSSYISQENYEETLHELIDLFYSFKNDTHDCISDDALIDYMKKAFNDECRGSLELLAGEALPALARKINERCAADPFENMEITDD